MINFGGVEERVITREEFPHSRAQEVLKNETIAVLGYGVQGPGQSLNMRDNGFRVIIGQREKTPSWDKAIKDGWVPGVTLFPLEEASKKGTVIEYLLSDAGQKEFWPKLKPYLTEGKTLFFSHGFSITYKHLTKVVPPKNVDVVMVATSWRGAGLTVALPSSRISLEKRRKKPLPWVLPWDLAISSKPPSRWRFTVIWLENGVY
jgi:ketol-acid reductoisomerase